MDDIYKNIEEYNPKKQQKILMIFNEMTADTLGNKKLNPIDSIVFLLHNIILLFPEILD